MTILIVGNGREVRKNIYYTDFYFIPKIQEGGRASRNEALSREKPFHVTLDLHKLPANDGK